jgi:four helix bundle protein
MGVGFEELVVWQKAHALRLFVHKKVLPLLPLTEKWDLRDQLQRSCKSVPSNIAEGYGRFYYKDNVRFCYNARGSLAETQDHLITAHDLAYITHHLYACVREQSDEVYRLLNGYINYLKKQQPGKNEPGHDVSIVEVRLSTQDAEIADCEAAGGPVKLASDLEPPNPNHESLVTNP